MSTHEERLMSLERDLQFFKTETIKAYQDVAMEIAMLKGLIDSSIRQTMELKRDMSKQFALMDERIVGLNQEIYTNFERIGKRLDAHDERFDAHDGRFDSIDEKLNQIVSLLTSKPE